jgi:hypothetical protein
MDPPPPLPVRVTPGSGATGGVVGGGDGGG